MKKKVAVCVLVLLIGCPTIMFGQVMSGTVGLLGFGPGWYAGAQRVIQVTVTRAGVTEVANIALTATMRGLLASSVIAAMIVAEPAFNSGVDAIRTWIATAGISRYNGGIGKASVWTGGPKVFVTGSADANSLAVIMGRHSQYPTVKVYNSYSDAGTAENSWYSGAGGYANARESSGDSAGNVSCGFGYLIDINWNMVPGSGIAFCGPNTTGEQVTNPPPPPPVVGTVADITGKLNTDLAAGVAAANAAADEAEDILNKGIPAAAVGSPAASPAVTDTTAAPPATGVVVATPLPQAMPDGSPTPAAEAATIAANNLPAGGAITTTPPAAGTSATTPPPALPYTDPGYSGSLTTVPWATPNDFAARWNTFQSSIQSSGLFGLWGSSFGSVPSGGSSTYTFNAGVFGNHTYDFSSWGSTVFGLLSGIVQIACGFVAVKIATLGHA